MSEKFFETTAYLSGKPNIYLTKLPKAGNGYFALMLSHFTSNKERLEYLLAYSLDLINALSNDVEGYESPMSEQGINLEYVRFLKEIARTLGYFMNCSSWRSQEWAAFDDMEIRNRLERIARCVPRIVEPDALDRERG